MSSYLLQTFGITHSPLNLDFIPTWISRNTLFFKKVPIPFFLKIAVFDTLNDFTWIYILRAPPPPQKKKITFFLVTQYLR